MQTLFAYFYLPHTRNKQSYLPPLQRAQAIIITLILSFTFSGCSVRIDQKSATATTNSSCAQAYQTLSASNHPTNISQIKQRAHTWKTLAISCPHRFTEGVIQSTRNEWQLRQYQNQNELLKQADEQRQQSYRALSELTQQYPTIRWSQNPLAQAASSEDKLAYILQTLAARRQDHALLSYSDQANSIANILMHAAGNEPDLRHKVYNLPQEALHNPTMRDKTTGVMMPVEAIAIMDCAREELQAFNQTIGITNVEQTRSIVSRTITSTKATNQQYANDVTHNAHEEASTNRINQITNAFMQALFHRVQAHLFYAYALGYPITEPKLS